MMRSILIIFTLLTSIFLFSYASNAQTVPSELDVPQGNFQDLNLGRADRIVKIIDPLVIELDNYGLVNLVGIDVPDYSPHEQGPIAESAVNILKDMALDQNVRLYMTQDRNVGRKNRMGHYLFHVVLDKDESWVQGVLVRLGLARVRSDKSNPEAIRDLYELEKKARAEKLGLWAFDDYKIKTPESVKDHKNSFQIVEGTVYSAARKQNNIFLNFENDWRKDFTIGISPSDIRVFNRKGINPLNLNGKKIRVRGWIRDYNGPYMELDHPERLEVLN